MKEYLVISDSPGSPELAPPFRDIDAFVEFRSVDSGAPSSPLGKRWIEVEENDDAWLSELTASQVASDDNGTLAQAGVVPEITGCKKRWSTPQPVWGKATFNMLQDTYRKVVPEEDWTIALFPKSGMAIPFEIRSTPDKGNGVFATSFIPKHTLVWHPVQSACFPDEATFRRFLSSLTWELACDVFQWAYVGDLWDDDDDDEHVLCLELDEASFINHAPSDQANVDELESDLLVATRDIEAGEEILQDYYTFSLPDDKLPWYEEMFSIAYDGEDDRFEE